MSRVWLITGASSGFGREVSTVALQKGDNVVATARDTSQLDHLKNIIDDSKARLLCLQCDVTKPSDISHCFKQAITHFGRCDVVFNNAGYGIVGEIESTPEELLARCSIRTLGAANVSREAVRVFRECKSGGRLLSMSSGAGFVGFPGVGYYSASKHALEGFTESLYKEVDPAWNIQIFILEPGSFKTNAHGKNAIFTPEIGVYSHPDLPSQQVRQVFASGKIDGDVKKAASKIYEFSTIPNPPLRWALGKDAIVGVKATITQVGRDVEEFEHWSEDLVLEEAGR